MNVVAKSSTLSPFLKATTSVISTGIRPPTSTGKVQRPALVVLSSVNPILSQSISENLLSGPLRVSSGVAVSTQVSQRRLAHTDIQWPDFSYYRQESVQDPKRRSQDSASARRVMPGVVGIGSGIAAAYAAKATVVDLLSTLSASADVLAMAKIEIKLDAIPEGKSVVFKWRGKPLFVRHRSEKEIQKEASVDVGSLRDPQADSERVQKPEWLVVLGVCTHLGCVPIANAGDFGGYYCPCHGSHYDASGRIRKGPAPLNLEVPYYEFQEGGLLVVG